MLKMTLTIFATVLSLVCAPATNGAEPAEKAAGQQSMPTPKKTGHLAVNGINYYYQVYGEGEPVLLLHGGLGIIEMLGPNLAKLAEGREVIGVDLQGHGRTPLGNRPIDLAAIGADMGILVRQLGYEQIDVLGYSMGGGVGLHMAAQVPETVRRLALVSTPFAKNGFYPEMIEAQAKVGSGMAEMMKETPMYKSYAAVAPDVTAFPKLLDAMGDLMRRDYDASAAVAKLTMPVMLVYGDGDMIRLEHIVDFYHRLGGGLKDAGWMRENMSKNRLAILPDLTHYDIFVSPKLLETVLPFLNGESGAKSWAEAVDGK
ncbi:pimeloyl-ACP methyl ester carboxylesterase [Sinorhizobium fredii]|uniref:Alpha/beta hydrolase Fold protein n=1 Tax=Sinorhizobium fredii (strain USDA 257) TaxID=1185652 RepID=I3X903_SINF2|nr:alpha/beta hydrolase [Sinorhizobium fredii]AFL52359.1 alpha/beta hydrolase Fold protein [Sinorhizobium fredii USDA 257]